MTDKQAALIAAAIHLSNIEEYDEEDVECSAKEFLRWLSLPEKTE